MPSLTRQQLTSLLEERMQRAYQTLSEDQELEAGTGLVKTHILEVNRPPGEDDMPAANVLNNLWNSDLFPEDSKPIIEQTDDHLLMASVNIHSDSPQLFFDVSDERFAILYSVSQSTSVDRVVERIVLNTLLVDHLWLDSNFLMNLGSLGAIRGLGLDFDRRSLYGEADEDEPAPNVPVNYLKMQLWGNRAGDVLELLRRSEVFPSFTAVSKLKLRHILDADDVDKFAIDDIRFDGKMTSRGTSFQSHLSIVGRIIEQYQQQLIQIESDHRIDYEAGDGAINIHGMPINIVYDDNLVKFDELVLALSNGKRPYRLLGVPVRSQDHGTRIQAIDLHVGHKINIEIFPGRIRLFLPNESCGNTVFRLLTNMQRRLDAQARIEWPATVAD